MSNFRIKDIMFFWRKEFMSIRKRIKVLLAQEQTTLTNIIKVLALNKNKNITINSLSQKLIKNTIKFREVEEILDVLDYDIIFKKRDK